MKNERALKKIVEREGDEDLNRNISHQIGEGELTPVKTYCSVVR